MPATTTARTPRTPWISQTPRTRQRPSTTPHGISPARTPASVGQPSAPLLSPNARSAVTPSKPRSPSPNYFGLIVEEGSGSPTDSNAGNHAKQNWKSSSSSIQSRAAASPHPVPVESNPDYEDFRKQAEAYAYNLSNGSLSRLGTAPHVVSSPLATVPVLYERSEPNSSDTSGAGGDAPSSDAMEIDRETQGRPARVLSPGQGSFDSPAQDSTIGPADVQTHRESLNGQLSRIDEIHPRLSLPQHRVQQLSNSERGAVDPTGDGRATSLPHSLSKDGPSMISAETLAELLERAGSDNYLLLDLRVSPQYAKSRLKGALNLCIPTTLLKRPSFNIQRLSDAFTSADDKARFARWKEVAYIIFYDANSTNLKDATSSVNTLKKFTSEGWKGTPYVVRGGFQQISKVMPGLLDRLGAGDGGSSKNLSISSGTGSVQIAGGCPMPATRSAANPFFGNIRQNMDLIGGVGQISIKIPDTMGPRAVSNLPDWLRKAVDEVDNGKAAAEGFLELEKAEQQRMQTALSGDVSYGTPKAGRGPSSVQIAGIEKGAKNRYKDMLPYDHSRVRLQNVPLGECDYINASHIKAQWSNRRYIAAQAPVPATFEDFWRVVWEQDVRVIVMLTAETEGGQRKCHPYWLGGKYGRMNVKSLSEKRVSLRPSLTLAASMKKSHLTSPTARPIGALRRRATNPHSAAAAQEATPRDGSSSDDSETPHLILRKLALHHAAFPFLPMREITQLQYSSWPDFGAPAHALDVLGLVEQCNAVNRIYSNDSNSPNSSAPGSKLPANEGERPIMVHCSAGCGRTGTFCTIDSVIDMLKRQRLARDKQGPGLLQKKTQAQSSSKRKENVSGKRGAKGDPDDMMVDDYDKSSDDDHDETTEDDAEDDTEDNSSDGEAAGKHWDWVMRDDVDLVAKTVEDFRLQRLSMVQTLRQYVLCYESVLEWMIKEMPGRFRKEGVRRSVGY